MRSMVEGQFGLRRTPPPGFARSPSPRKVGEACYDLIRSIAWASAT
jgi:hypothetical protein